MVEAGVRRSIVIFIGWSLVACAPDNVVYLPFPPIEQGSLVLALDRADHDPSFTVQAMDVGADTVLRPPEEIDRDETVHIEVLAYSGSLFDANLTAGPLRPATGDERERPLPAPTEVYRLTLPDGSPKWSSTDAASDRLSSFRIPDPGPRACGTFVSEPFPLGDDSSTEFAISVADDEVLIGMISGRLLRWTPTQLEEVEITPNTALSHGVFDEAGGDWWFITRFGVLYRGVFETPTKLNLTVFARSFVSSGRHRIVVRRDAGESRVYSMGSGGVFERFDETGATTLHTFADADFGAHTILTPEGDIVAAASGSLRVVRSTPDGELHIEAVPGEAGFTASAYVPGLGVVLGSSDGRFFAGQSGVWTEIGRSPLNVFPFAIVSYRGGFVYGAAFGAGGQYVPEGYCAVEDQLAAFAIQMMVEVGDGILALGENPNVPVTPGQLVRIQ